MASFKKDGLYKKHPWEIFAIEANPYVINAIPKAPDTTILNKAIWIKDGNIEFYYSLGSSGLSSVYKDWCSRGTKP